MSEPSVERNLGLVFAGGGNRAFYQLGLMEKWDHLWPQVAGVAGCSAGACMATFILSGRRDEAEAYWHSKRQHVKKNFSFRKLVRGQKPAPQGEIYFDTLVHCYQEGGLEAIAAQPFPIHILASASPRWLSIKASVAFGMAVYNVEKRVRPKQLHPKMTRGVGFRPRIYDARDCKTPEELAHLVMASSATPPFTPIGTFAGERLLDGGLIDNVPAFVLDDEPAIKRQLILLTRPYPPNTTGRKGDRLYVSPQGAVPINRWDYTSAEKVAATRDMGRREAEHHRSSLDQLLSELPGAQALAS